MSYENKSKLKVIVFPEENLEENFCRVCYKSYRLNAKYCKDDGNELVVKKISNSLNNIIAIFRDESNIAAGLIDNNGNSLEEQSDTIIDELISFSKKYPDAIFQVDITWDKGFNDPPSRFYVKDGKCQNCKVKITFEKLNLEHFE